MHFHHRKSALISVQMMFMLALPQTTFHLVSLDGNFFESEISKRALAGRRQNTAHQKKENDNLFDTSYR